MPFIRIETNCDFPKNIIDEAIAKFTELIHQKKGDPKSMILVVVNTKVNVAFGGDCEKPAAAVQLLSRQMTPEITAKLTEGISDILLDLFKIPAARMYIFFQNFTELYLVGWNRKTFDRILGISDSKEDLKAKKK